MHSSYSVVVLSLLVPVLGCAWGLKGTVSDPGGFVVPGAVVAVTCGGRSWSAKTGSQGRFVFPRWGPGENCGISVNYRGFAPFHRDLDRETESVSIRLNLAPLNQSITVASSSDAFTVPAFGTVSLSDVELQRVSNDTEDLLRYAKLMAGASASPDAIYVDGLPAAELPPAETIARITVNGDPFSAEYADGDLTHIDITTKGGDRKLRYGFGGFSFSAGGRNTLDPNFRSQSGSGNGYVSGPVPYFPLTFSLHGNWGSNLSQLPIVAVLPDAPDFSADRGLRGISVKNRTGLPPRQAPRSSPLRTSAQRFREAQREIQQADYFLKGTVLKRMMKCGQKQCACHHDPAKRHGPYFEWTYKAKGKTVNVKLSPQAAPLYRAATKQHRKLKAILARMERLSRTALAHLAKQTDHAD